MLDRDVVKYIKNYALHFKMASLEGGKVMRCVSKIY